MSETRTVPVHVAVLPAASVTVRVTELEPTFAQVKVVVLKDNPKEPEAVQLSEDPLFTCAGTIVAEPEPFRVTVKLWQTAVGAVTSPTVMVIVLELAIVGDAHASLEVTVQEMESPEKRLPLV